MATTAVPAGSNLGVELDFDLSQPLVPSLVYHLRELWREHGFMQARGSRCRWRTIASEAKHPGQFYLIWIAAILRPSQ